MGIVKQVIIVHRKSGNYKLHCDECGKSWGDFTSQVPAGALFREMAAHLRHNHSTSTGMSGYLKEA